MLLYSHNYFRSFQLNILKKEYTVKTFTKLFVIFTIAISISSLVYGQTPREKAIQKVVESFDNIRSINSIKFSGTPGKLWHSLKDPSVEKFLNNGFWDLGVIYEKMLIIDKTPSMSVKTFIAPYGFIFNVSIIASKEKEIDGENLIDFQSSKVSIPYNLEIPTDPQEKLSESDLQEKYGLDYEICYNFSTITNLGTKVYCKNNGIALSNKALCYGNDIYKALPILKEAVKTVFGKKAQVTPWKFYYISENFNSLWDENKKFQKIMKSFIISEKIHIL